MVSMSPSMSMRVSIGMKALKYESPFPSHVKALSIFDGSVVAVGSTIATILANCIKIKTNNAVIIF